MGWCQETARACGIRALQNSGTALPCGLVLLLPQPSLTPAPRPKAPITLSEAPSFQAGFLQPCSQGSDGLPRSPHVPTCAHPLPPHGAPSSCPTFGCRSSCAACSPVPAGSRRALGQGCSFVKFSICLAPSPPRQHRHHHGNPAGGDGLLGNNPPGWTTPLTPGTASLQGARCSQQCAPGMGMRWGGWEGILALRKGWCKGQPWWHLPRDAPATWEHPFVVLGAAPVRRGLYRCTARS